MHSVKFVLKPFQSQFVFSQARFPCFIGGIATGKSLCLILKTLNICNEYPDSLVLIVRKEFSDLRDSTIKDFQRYTGMAVDSNKEVKFPNKSTLIFRHGDTADLNVLRNLNLTAFGIEQADEYETEDAFVFLRDRLRRNNAPMRQGFMVGNVNGHNWVWRMWKNNPASAEYDLSEATTFDNADVLPQDFIADLRQMEIDAPNHYKRFVLNDWEEADADDYLFTWPVLDGSIKMDFGERSLKRILAVDCARFGDDKTVFTLLENRGLKSWEQTYIEEHQQKDLMWTVGRFIDLRREFDTVLNVVDDDGLGGGVTDRLRELGVGITAFKGGEKADNSELYGNRRAECFFKLQNWLSNRQLKVLDNHNLIDQLLTIRYKYNSRGQKLILSKDEMRKQGIKSPDMADALMMASSAIGREAIQTLELPQSQRAY